MLFGYQITYTVEYHEGKKRYAYELRGPNLKWLAGGWAFDLESTEGNASRAMHIEMEKTTPNG